MPLKIDAQEKQALRRGRERAAPPVLEIHEAIRIEGEHELARPVSALLVSALAAGLSMGFSFLAESSLAAVLPKTDWTPLVSKLGYSVGFLIVILGRQQLFTENTLTPMLALFSRPSWGLLGRLLRLWAVVLLANLCGTALFAAFVGLSPVFDTPMTSAMAFTSATIFEPSGQANFLRGILGGWLIAMMVWLMPFAQSSRIWVIVIVTYLVGVAHLSHIIAGSVAIFYAVITGAAPWNLALSGYLLPTLAGNTLGGVSLVAMLHHAQVRLDYHHKIDRELVEPDPE